MEKLLTVENSQLEVRPSGVCKYVCWKLQPSDAEGIQIIFRFINKKE